MWVIHMGHDLNTDAGQNASNGQPDQPLLGRFRLVASEGVRRDIFTEMLREVLGECLSKLPKIEAGYLDKKTIQGYVTGARAMGMVFGKRRYQKLFVCVPLWLDYLPTSQARRCMDLAELCNCALPEHVIDLFALQGEVHGSR
jgi:hypothetical protein